MEISEKQKFLFWLQGYYCLLAAVTFLYGFKKFASLHEPFSLTDWNSKNYGILLLFILVIFCFIAQSRPLESLWRRVCFLLLLMFEMHYNKVGAVTHLFQFWLWSAFILALMPPYQQHSEKDWFTDHLRKAVQYSIGMILSFYFLSGLWKLIGVFIQLIHGEPHFFTTNGLVYHLYSEILRAGANPLLKNLILQHREFNIFLSVSAVSIQIFAISGIFKTHYHRRIGYLLLAFHLGTAAALDITYPTNIILVIWALVLSPFNNSIRLTSSKNY